MHGWKLFLASFFALVYAGLAAGLFWALFQYRSTGEHDWTAAGLFVAGLLHSAASAYLVLLSCCATDA